MELFITIIHVTTCILLILTVLLQSGKGGGIGAALGGGGGAGSQIFGGRGASTFLTRITSGAAIVFFLTSMTLAGLGSRKESTGERLLRERQTEQESLSAGEGDSAALNEDESEPATEDTAATSSEAPVEAVEGETPVAPSADDEAAAPAGESPAPTDAPPADAAADNTPAENSPAEGTEGPDAPENNE